MTRGRASAAGLALALAGALAAQNGAGAPTDVATRLHEAWLREVRPATPSIPPRAADPQQ